MKLIKLSANKESFHTVNFNPEGISLIVASKKTDDKKKTYNSVGKSLTIAIVNFCLASNENEAFNHKLPYWEFSLEFEVEGVKYISRRNTSKQNEIFLNDEKFGLNKFREFFGKQLFYLDDKIKFLTFRTLISRFIRPYKSSYVFYNNFIDKEQEYGQLLNNAYLLGLDIDRISKKKDLKEKLKKTNDLKKAFDKDDIIKDYFQRNDDDIEIKIVALQNQIERLEQNLSQFRIAEDYNQIKDEADELAFQINTLKNESFKLQLAIKNIDKSLEIKPDISKSDIQKLYEKARIQLSEMILKRLEDLERFNEKILDNRSKSLNEEKRKFEKRLKDLQEKTKQLNKKKDQKLQYLDTHGALEEYTQLSLQLTNKKSQIEKLENYKKLKVSYDNELENLNKGFSEENISTNEYLISIDDIKKKNINLFQGFVSYFYKDKLSGITVENNTGINKNRYNIIAKIDHDAGDAVNEVKIFCFDWTILKAQHNHKVKFLFHDSRITDGMDTRQVEAIFRVAYEECTKEHFQYIISANHNVLESLQKELSLEDYNRLIQSNIVLELSDQSDTDKLLGIQVDLDYEKN